MAVWVPNICCFHFQIFQKQIYIQALRVDVETTEICGDDKDVVIFSRLQFFVKVSNFFLLPDKLWN